MNAIDLARIIEDDDPPEITREYQGTLDEFRFVPRLGRVIGGHDFRDELHRRLQAHAETDHRTGCWVWTGTWQPSGIGVIKVHKQTVLVPRVAWWVYRGGFNLFDPRYYVEHIQPVCDCPACFNPDHLRIRKIRCRRPLKN